MYHYFDNKVFLSYFDPLLRSFGSFLLAVTAYIVIAVLVMELLRILMGEKFRCGWRSVLWVLLPLVFLLPFKIITPIAIIELLFINFPIYIKSPELSLSGITEVHHFSTGAEAEGMLFDEVLPFIWLIGFVIALGYEAVMFLNLKSRLRRSSIVCSNQKYLSILKEISAELKIKTPRLYIFPESDTPFAAGIFRPCIMLPGESFSDEEISFIFRHEAVHIRRHDIAVKLGMVLFRCANWFNPAAYVMCRLAFEDMEITCDERASKGFTDQMRERYSAAILKGVSKNRYSAVTTYLSSTAVVLKKRISAVLTVKKFGSAIPLTVALISVMLLSCTVYAVPVENLWYAYTCPYPMESDPYITTEEWKTCTADNAEEAGKIIFGQYMDMYMGEDVPEYLRIEDYCITHTGSHSKGNHSSYFDNMNSFGFSGMGIFDKHEFAFLNYNVSYANKCGNTAHNLNFGNSLYFNGCAEDAVMNLELERDGNRFTVVNMGTVYVFGGCTYHFENHLTGNGNTLADLELMAKLGIFDKNRDLANEKLSPDEICSFAYYRGLRLSAEDNIVDYMDPYYACRLPFRLRYEYADFDSSPFVDIEAEMLTGGLPLSEAGFELCSVNFDAKTGFYKVYGNVTGDSPHGVILDFTHGSDEWWPHLALTKITVTEETYSPIVYHDSFYNIPLPEDIKNGTAEDILEYMKTPRDGCDFTVLDYSGVTAENGAVYADVKFKGRLEGVYSSDMLEEKSEPVIRVKIKTE